MFCEKCGTRVDDGQPFCPNCGNRLAPAPAAPAAAPAPARAPKAPRTPTGSPLDRLLGLPVLNRIFVLCTLGLLLFGMVMSWLKVLGKSVSTEYYKYHEHWFLHEASGSWLLLICTILSTLAIAALILWLLGKLNTRFILLFAGCVGCLLFTLLFIKWLAAPEGLDGWHLSVAGWFMLLAELGAGALGILSFLFLPKE